MPVRERKDLEQSSAEMMVCSRVAAQHPPKLPHLECQEFYGDIDKYVNLSEAPIALRT